MRKDKRFITVGLVLMINFSLILFPLKSNDAFCFKTNYVKLISQKTFLGLEEHPPVLIGSNNDFETLNFTGEGTELNPYIISNLYVNASGSTNGIQISNTEVHFVIKNCIIEVDYIGIRISAVGANTATIFNNTCISKSGDGGGIGITETSGCNITKNEFANFMQGIHLNYAHNNIITRNIIPTSNYQGINIRYSNYNEITYNTIKNSQQHGLAFVGTAHDNKVHHNMFINNSIAETYQIDGERSGDIESQGYDEGSNNIWYNEEGKYGNHWSDYDGSGFYSIDGSAQAEDIYPLTLTETETSALQFVTIILLVISLNCFLVAVTKKKTSK